MDAIDYKFRRVHPRSLIVFLASSALYYAILFLSFDSTSPAFLLVAGLGVLLALGQILTRFVFFKYTVNSGEIIIHSGVLNRVRRNIPSDRIQNVALERSVPARILNLTAVKIETAGSVKAEGVLEYVTVAEAERIRTLLRSAKPAEVTATTPAKEPDFAISLPQVLISGMYTFSLIYFAAGWAIFSQLDQFGLIDFEALLESLVSEQINGFIEQSPRFSFLLVVPIMFGGLLLGWVTGIGIHMVRYYGFRLELRPKKIHRRFGLFTLRETTIPYPRVQSLVLRSNPLMRLHNQFRLVLQTLAFDANERGMQMAIPLARLPQLLPLARRIHDFSLPDAFSPVSRISIRRMGLRYSLALAALVMLVQVWWSPAFWGFILLPVLWLLAWLQYLCHSWAFTGSHLYVRRGVFWQKVWIVPANRFQAIQQSATFLQRRMGVCQVSVDTAGAGAFQYPRIVDLAVETAANLVPALYEAFRKSMALNGQANGIDTVHHSPDQTDPPAQSHLPSQVSGQEGHPQHRSQYSAPINKSARQSQA